MKAKIEDVISDCIKYEIKEQVKREIKDEIRKVIQEARESLKELIEDKPIDNIEDRYLTVNQAAIYYRTSSATIYQWVRNDQIPHKIIGGKIFVEKLK